VQQQPAPQQYQAWQPKLQPQAMQTTFKDFNPNANMYTPAVQLNPNSGATYTPGQTSVPPSSEAPAYIPQQTFTMTKEQPLPASSGEMKLNVNSGVFKPK
jgi:hypothetical protein